MIISSVLDLANTALDKFIADPKEKSKAKLALLKAQQNGELKEMEISLSAIIAEAQSKDKWTSRARPSFLYVMYTLILACIPMGGFFMYDSLNASLMVEGMQTWLEAIPESMWMLFGSGYLGYVGARSFDKNKK